MAKKVSFSGTPKPTPNIENWVDNREVSQPEPEAEIAIPEVEPTPDEPKMKRLTLDIPDELHRKIKGKAVAEGVTMVEMLRKLLETNYG